MDHVKSLTPHGLADALGDVRAEIRVLRAREATLRQALIEARPNGPVAGQRYEVFIRENQRRVFDRDSLPKAILHDDRFWMTRVSQTVVTRALDAKGGAVVRPEAWPGSAVAARAADAPVLDLWGRETGLVLIEEF